MNLTARSYATQDAVQAGLPSPRPRAVMLTIDRHPIDRRVMQEANSLEKVGWSVTIIGMPLDPGNKDTDPRIARISTGARSAAREARILPLYRWARRLLPMNAPLMRLMKAFAWRVLADQETFYLRLYEETLTGIMADVFVAHDLPMLAVARRAADRCNAKLVYDSHELYCEQEFSGWEKRRWKEIENKYIRSCDQIITINPSIARELKDRYGVAGVEVIHNAECATKVPASQKLFHKIFKLAPASKILLYQGGLTANRNIETLVAAMRHVRNPELHLVVLGDGGLRKKLEKIAAKQGTAQRVHFHDAVPQSELLRHTACADAGIIPYRATCMNNFLCTPNKLFEFITAGLPILANDLPELRRIIGGNDIGLLGDMAAPEGLAKLIDDFFSGPARVQNWRANVRKAGKSLCWAEEEKKLVALYESLLKDSDFKQLPVSAAI